MRRLIAITAATFALAAFSASTIPVAHAAKGDGKYCLVQFNGAKNCSYRTKAACEKNKGANADFCERYNGTSR